MEFSIPTSKEELFQQGKYFAMAAAGLGAISLVNRGITMKTKPLPQLSIPDMDAIYTDYDMVQALKIMEHWSKLNPIFYEQIVIYLDNMLNIERSIITKETFPTLKGLDCAYQNFRLAIKYLTDYRETIQQYCGADDVSAFDPFLKIVYTRAQEHFLTIVNKCRHFDTKQYIASAQQRVEQIIATR
jgi:hypothetical protein